MRNTVRPVFTFGKHAGHSVDEVRQDTGYCAWLREQAWFRVRFPHLWRGLFATPVEKVGNVIQWASIRDRFERQETADAAKDYNATASDPKPAQASPPTRRRRTRAQVATVIAAAAVQRAK